MLILLKLLAASLQLHACRILLFSLPGNRSDVSRNGDPVANCSSPTETPCTSA
jgi:hypothetical protein